MSARQQAFACDSCEEWQHRTCGTLKKFTQVFYRQVACGEIPAPSWNCANYPAGPSASFNVVGILLLDFFYNTCISSLIIGIITCGDFLNIYVSFISRFSSFNRSFSVFSSLIASVSTALTSP